MMPELNLREHYFSIYKTDGVAGKVITEGKKIPRVKRLSAFATSMIRALRGGSGA
jgi:hypothetical protein